MRTLALLALLCLGGALSAKHLILPLRGAPQPADDTQQAELKPFQKGTEHNFIYNVQIASGLIAPSDEDASDPQQKAVTRIQCHARLQFASDRHAQLHLQKCRAGQQNEPMAKPEKVQPMDAFEPKKIPEEKQQQLELPCQFSYEDGVIERVQFHDTDEAWSKNIKRAVLNMIQMNLKRNNAQGLRIAGEDQSDNDEDLREEQQAQQAKRGKTFTIPEITLEGACQTTYTIYKAKDMQKQEKEKEQFNVTKSINFKQCQKIADVAYGYQTQQAQAECAQCHQAQQQGVQPQQKLGQQQQNSEQHPCAKCDPKEVKEQEMDRSTVIRCQIQGPPSQKYILRRCELISQYVYRNGKIEDGKYGSAMQTVVSASLQARGGLQVDPQMEQIPAIDSGKDESLMFSNEWDVAVKRFYMFGDDEFGQNGKESPFAQVPKVQQAEQALRKLVQAMQDKQQGIEAQAPAQLQRLAEMMRMSTQAELKRIEQQTAGTGEGSSAARMSTQDKQHGKQIFADALALCGTRNCVAELAQKIKNKELDQVKAVHALFVLKQLPAPSDAIVKEMEQLCASEAVHGQSPVKQSCWLTFGALVNELCQYKTEKNAQRGQSNGRQSGFYQQEQCPMEKRQQYKEAMMAIYQNSDCIYDKMVALTALGNAGLDISVGDLEQIIKNPLEARVVRVKAIDALRRLRVQMPRKILRILVPIFQNTREHAQVRTAAFAIAMYAQPESQVVDQLMYTIAKEPNKQVRSFAYRTMRMMANSQKPNERKMAQHIKATLKLAKVEEQELRASGKWQVPLLYNQEQEEGIFVTMATTISAHSALPVYAHAQLDSQFNEHFQINTAKLYMMQQEAEQWYRKVAMGQKWSQKMSRAQRQSGNRYSDNLRNIFKSLGIKGRQSDQGQDQAKDIEFEQYPYQGGNNQPFAMLCIRTNDVDRGFLALDQHFVSEETRQLLNNGDMQKLYGLAKLLLGQLQPQKIGTMVGNMHEKQAQIPTSAGVPLRLLNSMPVLANIQGQIRVNTEMPGLKMDIDAQVAASVAHLQKMECWTPFVASGVQSIRSIEINVPLQAEMSAELSQGISIKLQVPQHKTQLVGARSLPITYTAAVDPRTGLVREPSRMRTVHNPKLERQQHEVDMEVASLKSMAMPLRIQGHYHWPSKPTSFQQFVQLLMATENAVKVTYQPGPDSPREVIFRMSAKHFQKAEISEHPQLTSDFYSTQLENPYACEPEQCKVGECEQCDELEKQRQEDAQEMEEEQQQLQAFIGEYKKTVREQYKHSLQLSMQTRKGSKDAKAQCQMQVQCDEHAQFCKVQLEAERTPMFPGESEKWTLKAQAELLMPETEAPSMAEDKKHKQFIGHMQAQWGVQGQQNLQQKVTIRVQGTQAHTPQILQILQQQKREGRELISAQQMHNFQRRTAFLNKFQVEAKYSLKAKAQNAIRRMLEVLKTAYFWNTRTQLTGLAAQRNGKAMATFVIDPITQKHANLTIKTPVQQVRLEQIELPLRMRPFSLIRLQSAQQIRTLGQLLFDRFDVDSRAECTADGQTVDTFDDYEYRAPLLTSCYSVLAKDCGSEHPQFAVLMKKAPEQPQKNTEKAYFRSKTGQYDQKKLKVMTPEAEIECQPETETMDISSRQQPQLICWINGRQVDPQDPEQQAQVQYNDDQMSDVTIRAEGVAVRFNGRKAWLKLSPMYKNAACGLCGHYDDSAAREDEWRMPNGQIALDSAQFHRSYALKETKVCTEQELDKFYAKDKDSQGEYYQQLSSFTEYPDLDNDEYQGWQDEQFDGQIGFEQNNNDDFEQQQEDMNPNPISNIFGIDNEQCCCCCAMDDMRCRLGCKQSEQCAKKCEQRQCKPQKEEEEEKEQCEGWNCQKVSPVLRTKVSEQNHAVCFSANPVKQCPPGTVPLPSSLPGSGYFDELEQDQDDAQYSKTVRFVCLDRADPETRRLVRMLRQGRRVVDVAGRGSSFTERIREPEQCQYRGRN